MKINSSNDFKKVGTWREEAGISAELTGHHLFFEKESNFLRSCHTVNFEMDLNQLVADITMKKRSGVRASGIECMIVFCFDFGGFGQWSIRHRMILVTTEEEKDC